MILSFNYYKFVYFDNIIFLVVLTVFDDTKKESTLEALNGAASFIRGELSKRVEIRHTPELKFIYDTSIEYGNHIEKIIEQINEEK